MAYNASLANFLETQGIPYMGSPVMDAGIASLQTPSYSMPVFDPYTLTSMDASQAKKDAMVKGELEAIENKGKLGLPGFSETPVKQFLTPNPPGTPPPTYTDLINQAYGSIGVTSPDQPGAQYWASQLQSGAIRPEDFQRSFLSAATGVTDPTYAANVAKAQELLGGLNTQAVNQAYQTVLGRAGDTAGIDYFTQQLASGALRPQDLKSTLAQAAIPVAKTLEDRLALQKYLGKDIYAPADFLRGTSGMGYEDIVNYINANVQDPVKVAQIAAQYGIDPTEILTAKKAVGGQDMPTLKDIEDYLAQGRAGFEKRFGDISTSVIGTNLEDLTRLEGTLDYLANTTNLPTDLQGFSGSLLDKIAKTESGFDVGSLTSALSSKDFANLSLEEIQDRLSTSKANKIEEAFRIQNLAKTIYGLSDKDATQLAFNLYQGKETDSKQKEFYDELLKTGFTKDLQNRLLMDAAVKAPTSKFFQDNPEALAYYKPLGKEVKKVSEGAYQYGADPRTSMPFLSLEGANQLFSNKNIHRSTHDAPDQNIQGVGADPHSRYQGMFARGVGIYGVDATTKNISDFDKIQKEIDRLGGVKTERDPEGNVREVVYKEVRNPETNEKSIVPVDVRSLFSNLPGYDPETGVDTYGKTGWDNFQSNKAGLQRAAQAAGVDINSYKNLSEAYNDLNKRLGDNYIWQGRTQDLDPGTATFLGLTPEEVKANNQHATVQYRKVGDKLVPVETIRTFKFQDPNTTRGFLGDLAGGIAEVLSIPPIAMFIGMMGGLPSLFSEGVGLGGTAFGAPNAASSVSNLANTIGKNLGFEGANANLVGQVLLNSGTSGLMTGLATGDLGQAGKAFLTTGAGTGIAGLSAPYVKNVLSEFVKDNPKLLDQLTKVGSETLGGTVSSALSGRDVGDYLKNRLFSTGIGSLMNTTGQDVQSRLGVSNQTVDMIKAFAPIITSRRVSPEDIVRIAQTLQKYETTA